ncbi:hypothetical protein Leryth_023377 [Lithospermum erythrorhizon]|nr:hypothetical protein Leryth_023377 [Lithospermum erythrorhizon]
MVEHTKMSRMENTDESEIVESFFEGSEVDAGEYVIMDNVDKVVQLVCATQPNKETPKADHINRDIGEQLMDISPSYFKLLSQTPPDLKQNFAGSFEKVKNSFTEK